MQDDYSALKRFLDDASRPAEAFTFHEPQGFLFAIASSPDTVPPLEWLPMIGNDESLNFADEAEAEKILGLVMNLYNEINLAVQERRNALPRDCAFHDDLWTNFDDDASIAQWSRGFSAGMTGSPTSGKNTCLAAGRRMLRNFDGPVVFQLKATRAGLL